MLAPHTAAELHGHLVLAMPRCVFGVESHGGPETDPLAYGLFLEQANVGGFVLPFANPRHQHEYRVLQQFPLADDQIIAAGVIDDLTGFVEHPEVVADRLENVARAVGDPKRVMACTDCGFDTSAGMGRVTEDVVWAKLAVMAEGARIATQRLF
jgi:5-methyltetrahydropteroyltriglutamate--homocysteine methyltransferase